MLKKVWTLLLISLLLIGCSNNNQKQTEKENENNGNGKYESVTIKTHLTNEDARDDKYLVFLLTPGEKELEPGEATQDGFYGPFETDENGEVKINLSYDYQIASLIEGMATFEQKGTTKKDHLQVIITTKEDKYIRNPLNKETYIQFAKNEDEATKGKFSYYATKESIDVDFTDKYPDGVLSLTFPDATFVIKLEFEEGVIPTSSYEVSIHKPSSTGDGIGNVRTGRVAREFQYWDTPFFTSDKLESWDGTIIVKNFETNAIVQYEGYPKNVSFDDNGKCEQGDIIKIKINK